MDFLQNIELLNRIETLAGLLNAMCCDGERVDMDDVLKALHGIEAVAEDGRVWFQLMDWNEHPMLMVETFSSKVRVRLDVGMR